MNRRDFVFFTHSQNRASVFFVLDFFLLLGRFAGACAGVGELGESEKSLLLCVLVCCKKQHREKKEFDLLEICATKTNKKIRKEFAPDFCEGEVFVSCGVVGLVPEGEVAGSSPSRNRIFCCSPSGVFVYVLKCCPC